jgi:CRISPR-associated endonuclease Cas2
MTSIVAYDIEENRIRARLARYLKSKGVRIQKSVFAVEVERHQFKRFLAEIKKIVAEEDKVAVFRLCEGCKKNAVESKKTEPFSFIF